MFSLKIERLQAAAVFRPPRLQAPSTSLRPLLPRQEQSRTSFGRGVAGHDTSRLDAARIVQSGEADAGMRISAHGLGTPPWKRKVPPFALVAPQTAFAQEPQVYIEIGCPGIDYGAAEYGRETSSIIGRQASRPNAPSIATVISQIAQHIEGDA